VLHISTLVSSFSDLSPYQIVNNTQTTLKVINIQLISIVLQRFFQIILIKLFNSSNELFSVLCNLVAKEELKKGAEKNTTFCGAT